MKNGIEKQDHTPSLLSNPRHPTLVAWLEVQSYLGRLAEAIGGNANRYAPDKVIFDTSVYIRAIRTPNGPEAQCIAYAKERCEVIVTRELIRQVRIRLRESAETGQKAAELMRFLKTYAHPERFSADHMRLDTLWPINLAIRNKEGAVTVVSNKHNVLQFGYADDPNERVFIHNRPDIRIVDPATFIEERRQSNIEAARILATNLRSQDNSLAAKEPVQKVEDIKRELDESYRQTSRAQFHLTFPEDVVKGIKLRAEGVGLTPNDYMSGILGDAVGKLSRDGDIKAFDKVIFTDDVYYYSLVEPRGWDATCLALTETRQAQPIITEGIIAEVERTIAETGPELSRFGDDVTTERSQKLLRHMKEGISIVAEPAGSQANECVDAVYYARLAGAEGRQHVYLVSNAEKVLRLGNPWTVEGAEFLRQHPNVQVTTPKEFAKERENLPVVESNAILLERHPEQARALDNARREMEAASESLRAIENSRSLQQEYGIER
jgi:predicted nucleic acid-binding protein